jgi:hypothetical protein
LSSQKNLAAKVVGIGKMRIPAKNGVKIRKLGMELAQTMVKRVESQVKSCLVAFFVKSFSMKHWYAMFDIFTRLYITYHDSMHMFYILDIDLGSHFTENHLFCPFLTQKMENPFYQWKLRKP